jgi:hypothetical protein
MAEKYSNLDFEFSSKLMRSKFTLNSREKEFNYWASD